MIKKTIGIIPRNLIKNKKRTAAIAISIILSIILITSIEILIRSVVNASVEANGQWMGKYHSAYRNMFNRDLNRLKENEKIDSIGTTAFVGYGYLGQNKLEINGIDNKGMEMLNVQIMEGKYPTQDNEVAIEKWILDKSQPGIKVGDKIKLQCEWYKRSAGNVKNIEEIEFVLSGILNNAVGSRAMGYGKGYLTIKGAEKIVPPGEIRYKQYFTIRSGFPIEDTVQYFNDDYSKALIGDYEINTPYIDILDSAENSRTIILFIDVIIALIAAIMIYNIFNISIVERLRHFGLLRTIGITPLQIKAIVIGEAVLLGIVFIPVGIVAGVNLTKLLVAIVGGFGGKSFIINSNSYNIATITAVGFISIILSAYKPAKMASNVSPIEALNSGNNIINKNTAYRNEDKINTRMSFNYTDKMARNNIKRNKKRFIATVISISMGVTIFIGINYFIGGFDPEKEIRKYIESDYVISLTERSENVGYTESDINEISEIDGIKKVNGYKFLSVYTILKDDNMTEYGVKDYENQAKTSNIIDRKVSIGVYEVNTYLIGCSKEEMASIRDEFNISTLRDEKPGIPSALIIQNIDGKQFCNLKSGDKIQTLWNLRGYPQWQKIYKDFDVEAAINENPIKIGSKDTRLIIITEEDNIEKLFGTNGYQRILVSLQKKINDVDSIEEKLETIISHQKSGQLISFREDLENIRKLMSQVTIILYALFSTVVLVTIVNIANTISMNVITRKREFGMLRAIGMTMGQLRKMIIREGLIYGLVGAIAGSILGIGFSYLIYIGAKGSIISDLKWEIHYGVICLVFVITMVITTVSTLIPLKKATDMEIVESIRAVE